MPVQIVWEPDQLREELEAARADTKTLRKAVAEACGFFMSEDGTKITVHIDNQLFQPSVTEYYHYDTFQGLEHQIYELEKENRRLLGYTQFLEKKIKGFVEEVYPERKQPTEEVW